jgi:hypothetical protein
MFYSLYRFHFSAWPLPAHHDYRIRLTPYNDRISMPSGAETKMRIRDMTEIEQGWTRYIEHMTGETVIIFNEHDPDTIGDLHFVGTEEGETYMQHRFIA